MTSGSQQPSQAQKVQVALSVVVAITQLDIDLQKPIPGHKFSGQVDGYLSLDCLSRVSKACASRVSNILSANLTVFLVARRPSITDPNVILIYYLKQGRHFKLCS